MEYVSGRPYKLIRNETTTYIDYAVYQGTCEHESKTQHMFCHMMSVDAMNGFNKGWADVSTTVEICKSYNDLGWYRTYIDDITIRRGEVTINSV